MHIAFIAYGEKHAIDYFLKDLEHQNFILPVENRQTKEKKNLWIKGHLRILPFGIYEIIFPKEYKDQVLNTLIQHEGRHNYNLKDSLFIPFRKILGLKKIPKKYDKSQHFLWKMDNISIFPVGMKEDAEHEDDGFWHESL